LIQLCSVAICADVAAAAGDGGMGETVLCIRCKATWASVMAVFAGSVLVKSA
jgi:hypothetical protein